jgi:hypothetical protein
LFKEPIETRSVSSLLDNKSFIATESDDGSGQRPPHFIHEENLENSKTYSTKRALVKTPPLLSDESLFGPPPLIYGEDPAAYYELLSRVGSAIDPKDIFESFWARDVADHFWEILRMRRSRAHHLTWAAHLGLHKVLGALIPRPNAFTPDEALNLSLGWAKQDPAAQERVEKLLAESGRKMEEAMANTLVLSLDSVERIDRLIASNEGQRNSAMHEIERHRSALGAALREAAENIEDAEFNDVENGEGRNDSIT